MSGAVLQTTITLNDHFSAALRSMNNALNMAIGNFESVSKASKNAFNEAEWAAVRSEIAKSNSHLSLMDDHLNKAAAAQDKLNNKMLKGSGFANNLWGKIKAIGAAYLGWQTVKTAVGAADTYANNTARLGLLTGGNEAQTKALQQSIYEASQRSLTDYNAMSASVAKLGLLAGRSFTDNDEIVQFTEILNKQFRLGGASIEEANAAMYQLTQAMASGRLQGDEFRSILENAPMLTQAIAKEMGVLPDKLKEMASEGKISADIIKNAMFSSAEDVEKMWGKLPMTFGGLWTQVVNKVNKGLEPLYVKLGQIWNNPKVQTFIDSLVNGFLMVANVSIHLFEILAGGFALIYNNWDIIEAILIGVATYYLPTIISLLWTKAKAIWASVSGWLILNWHILLIVAAIAAVVLAVKYLGVTFSDVCGFIAGVVMWCISTIVNTFVYMYNTCLHIVDSLANAVITFAEVIWNALTGGFTGWIGGVKAVWYSFVQWIYNLIRPLVELWDKFKGTNYAATIQAGINADMAKVTTSKYKKFNRSNILGQYGMSPMDGVAAYNKGFKWGSGVGNKITDGMSDIVSKVKDSLGFGTGTDPLGAVGSAMKNANAPVLDKLDNIDKNTSSSASSLAKSSSDLTHVIDLAEQEAINRYTLTDLKVEMNNNNNINSKMDLDTVLGYLQEKVYESVLSTAEGLHF